MFDYDTWLSTQPEPQINVWDIDETEDRAYDEWKDNVAMGCEYQKKGENIEEATTFKKV